MPLPLARREQGNYGSGEVFMPFRKRTSGERKEKGGGCSHLRCQKLAGSDFDLGQHFRYSRADENFNFGHLAALLLEPDGG